MIKLALILLLLFLAGCVSKNKETYNVDYMVFTKPWPGSEQKCLELAKSGFEKICQETLLKESPIITCERWWAQTEVYQGLDEENNEVCVMQIPKQLVAVKI